MKNILLTCLLVLFANSCKGQSDTPNTKNKIKKDTMEHINIEDFKKGNYTNEHGDFVQQFKGTNNTDYIVNIKRKNIPVTFIKTFHERSRNIKVTGQRFYGFVYGVWREYDEKGKLIKETNNDQKYPFTIDELCKLIQSEYGVNLMIKSDPNKRELQYTVVRRYIADIGKNCYVVTFHSELPDEGDFYARKNVYIDGVSGKVLYEEPIFLQLRDGDKIPKSKTSFPQKTK